MRMKKLLLMATAFLASVVTMAQTVVTLDLTAQGYTNAEAVTSLTQDGVTMTLDKGSNGNAPKYYTAGDAVRLYGGNTMELTAKSSITKVVFTFGTGDGTNDITADNK